MRTYLELVLLTAYALRYSHALTPAGPINRQSIPLRSASSEALGRPVPTIPEIRTPDQEETSEHYIVNVALNAEKIFGVSAASAVAGFLLLSHADSAFVQDSVHTLQHVILASGSKVWSSYQTMLTENPIATKAATSATVYSIGDVIAQKTEGSTKLDLARTTRSGLAGGIGHGPLSHFWYNLSEDFFNNVAHLTAWWSFLPKIVVDQTVWGPIWNSMYILLLGTMKMENADKMTKDIKKSTIPLLLDGLKLWPLAHCVTYGLVPVENRLLWVDTVEILWVTILATRAASLSSESEEKQQEGNELLSIQR